MTLNKNIRNNEFLLGVSYRYSYYDDDTTATYDEITANNRASITHLPGIFIQNQTQLNAKNIVLVGLRYDYNSNYGSIVTPRLNYKINNRDKTSTLRLSAWT